MVFKKGHKSWNLHLTKETDERINKMAENTSESRKRLFKEGKLKPYTRTIEHKNSMSKVKMGHEVSEEQIKKESETMKKKYDSGEKIAWNKNLTKETDERVRRIGNAQKTRERSLEERKRVSITKQGITESEWTGFKSLENYDNKFIERFRRAIRKRDNYVCMLCGVHSEKLKQALDIHHCDYNKKLTIPQNCISLCRNCHAKVNSDRIEWTKFFQSKMAKLYEYKYEDGNVILNFEQKIVN